MAYLMRPSAAGQSRALLSSAAPAGGPAAATSSPAGAQATTQPGTQPGAGYDDLRAYLAANGEQAKGYAAKIAGGIGNEAKAAAGMAEPAPTDWSPAGMKARDDAWAAKVNPVRDAARGKVDAVSTPAGLETFLGQQNGPGYTQGMSRLDSYLMAGQGLGALKDQWSPLLQPVTPSSVLFEGGTSGAPGTSAGVPVHEPKPAPGPVPRGDPDPRPGPSDTFVPGRGYANQDGGAGEYDASGGSRETDRKKRRNGGF